MTALFAVLISGVLLNAVDVPVPEYHLVFEDANGKLVGVVTDKDGKFQVDADPGTYHPREPTLFFSDRIERIKIEAITVDEKASTLRLKLQVIENKLELIRGTIHLDPQLGPRG